MSKNYTTSNAGNPVFMHDLLTSWIFPWNAVQIHGEVSPSSLNTTATHANIWASQPLSMRLHRADMACSSSLVPPIQCFLQGSKCSLKLLKPFSVSASKNLCSVG